MPSSKETLLKNRDKRLKAKRDKYWQNREVLLARQKEYYQRTKETRRKKMREYYQLSGNGIQRSRIYGLSEADYKALLLAQNNSCAICELACKTGKRLAVDHNHSTGKVRGLLCDSCNRGIGFLQDNPSLLREAALYIENR